MSTTPPGGGMTPPGPPIEPDPAPPPPPAGPRAPMTHPYVAARPPAPQPETDTGLGWTGFGLALAVCVPCLPLVGLVIGVVVLVRRRFVPRWAAGVAVVVGLLGSGLQLAVVPSVWEGIEEGIEESTDDPTDDANEVVPARLRTGDCFDDPVLRGVEDGEVVEGAVQVEIVPCHRPHDFEVYDTIRLKGKVFPGKKAVERRTAECVPRFEPFMGLPYARSTYEIYQYFPTARSWSLMGDRTISCIVAHPGLQKLRGSLEGARR